MDVWRAGWHAKIVIPILGLALWVSLLTLFGYRAGLWDPDLIKDTVIWFFGSAMALLFRLDRALKDEHFFRRTALSTVGFAVFLEFVLNVYVLGLVAEFLLQPLLVFLTMLSAVAATKAEYRPVKILADSVSSIIGLSFLIFAAYKFVVGWRSIDALSAAYEFALPIWMTIELLPYLYLVSVYAAYDDASVRLNHMARDMDKEARRRVQLALVLSLHCRYREVASFAYPWNRQAAEAPSLSAARQVIKEYRASYGSPEEKVGSCLDD